MVTGFGLPYFFVADSLSRLFMADVDCKRRLFDLMLMQADANMAGARAVSLGCCQL